MPRQAFRKGLVIGGAANQYVLHPLMQQPIVLVDERITALGVDDSEAVLERFAENFESSRRT